MKCFSQKAVLNSFLILLGKAVKTLGFYINTHLLDKSRLDATSLLRHFLLLLKRLLLKPGPGPWNWTLKSLDPEKPGA